MKPNFALSLSFDSICLLQRASGGWRIVGEVSPEAPDLAEELAALRKTGTALAPDGLRCKVVIPNEQIRYLTLDTPALSLSDARDAARDALALATPYAIDDLAFDVVQVGETTEVAAVALETLQEAANFATEHRFHPVSFVAIPGENRFAGEPYFGPAQGARALLDPGQTVEPDAEPIVILRAIEQPGGPVADVAADIPVAAPPAPEAPAIPAFKSARGEPAVETESTLNDALASLRVDRSPAAGVTDPLVPPRDVETVAPAFASRRSSDAPAPFLQAPLSETAQPVAGFAEDAEPFVPKPSAKARPRAPRTPLPAPGPVTSKVASEADRLTVFGARVAQQPGPTARRMPLGLTAALAVVLVGVGTWSFGNLQDRLADWMGRTTPDAPTITAIEQAPPIDPAPDVPGTDAENEQSLASLQPELSDEDAAVLDALRAPLIVDETPEASSAEDQRALYAATGIWPQAPVVPDPPTQLIDIEDLYITSIDPIEPAFDAVALPDVASFDRDLQFDAPGSPAAAGTTFALDERGLVVASANGTLSPDGIKVFAGAPPVRPAAFPAREDAVAALDPADAALAEARPRTRPSDLVENTERAVLDGLTRSELAEFRPPERPTLATVVASAAAASLVPLDDDGPATIEPSDNPLALAASLRPDARPANFNQIVARAQQTAASAASIGAASIAAPAPAATAAVVPRIPSSASVAREATLRNAINLRKVNLIGVYGTPSARRALVRLSNGRYKKVQVGDRIDGGRVSAIGEGELRYEKRGRNIVLKMPRG